MKTAIINARIRPQLKTEVEGILSQLGITTTQAITMFFEQVRVNKGIPFDLKLPNEETIQAIEDARNNRDMVETSIDELRRDLTE